MNGKNPLPALVAAAIAIGSCAAQAAAPAPLLARTRINGLDRQAAHDALVEYCRAGGFRILHESLSSVACRRQLEGTPTAFLAEPASALKRPDAPELTLSFRFVPDRSGVMRITVNGWTVRHSRFGDLHRSPARVGDVQSMLERTRRAWYEAHPQLAPGIG